jgi:hypothetical protein
VHWMLHQRRERKPRPEARLYVIRGASELERSYQHEALYAIVEWVLTQAREPRGCDSPELFRLQLHQNPSYTPHESGNGRWRDRSAMERRRFGSPLGSLRTAEGGKSGVNDGEQQLGRLAD